MAYIEAGVFWVVIEASTLSIIGAPQNRPRLGVPVRNDVRN